jgi:hypothetical protein
MAAVGRWEENEKCTQNFSWKIRSEETTWGPWRRWEENIKMYLNKIEGESVEWIHLAQDNVQ